MESGKDARLPHRYNIFISYNWRDHEEVEAVACSLRERGLTVFLDRWYLVPGRSWLQALEEALSVCRAAAIFIGPHGLGPWQQREKDLALDRQSREPAFLVIPVLLRGADPALGFLNLNTWVDLRGGVEDSVSLAVLTAAVQGEPPGPHLRDRVTSTLATLCPFRGLRPFREEDAPFFLGREAFTTRLVEEVEQHTLVAVVGASGSGKSSVVRAGLIPQLRRWRGGKVWDVVTLVPGDRPLHALASALLPLLEPDMTETDRLAEVGKLAGYLIEGCIPLRDVVVRALEKQPGTDRLLLVVDQWEELYTLSRGEQVRHRFLDEVLEATQRGALSVVLTLRGDFFGHALSDRPLADRLQSAVVNLGPMTQGELELAVEGPARKVGLTFEPGLVKRILEDVQKEPGNLPLLEFVLTELWEKRRGGYLLHEAYESMSGVQGAIAQRADEVLARLTPLEQETARRIFLQLVRPGEGTEDTRQRATAADMGEAVWPVAKELADARLLVTGRDEATGEETVEVAHEALIRTWGLLRTWLDEDREFLLWRQRLRAALAEWERTEHDKGILLRGAPLAEAKRWLAERSNDLTAAERGFMQESTALNVREEEEEKERQRRELRQAQALAEEQRRRSIVLRRLLTISGVLLVVVVGAMLTAWYQRQSAEQQRALAVEQQQVAEQQRNIALSRQLAAQALLAAQQPNGFNGGQDRALLLALEATRIADAPEVRGNLLRVLQGSARLTRTFHGRDDRIAAVAFSPDGHTVASAGGAGSVQVWNMVTGREKFSFSRGDSRALLGAVVTNIPADKRNELGLRERAGMLVERVIEGYASEKAGIIVGDIIEKINGKEVNVDEPPLEGLRADESAAFHIIREHQTLMLTVRLGALVLDGHGGRVNDVAYSPNGRILASAGQDGTIRLWSVTTGLPMGTPRQAHDAEVRAVAFSPDGRALATAAEDGAIRLWDVATGAALGNLPLGHEGPVLDVTFSPDGDILASAGQDGTVRLWEVTTSRAPSAKILRGHDDAKFGIDSTPENMAVEGGVHSVTFHPDGGMLASAGEDGTIRLWDTAMGTPIGEPLRGHRMWVYSVAFSPDGRMLASAGWDGTVRLWDVTTHTEIGDPLRGHGYRAVGIAFHPTGKFVASAGWDGTVRLWDIGSRAPLGDTLGGHEGLVSHLALTPDGKVLASASWDGTVRLWEVATRVPIGEPLRGHLGSAHGVAFGTDAKVLASTDARTVRLWDLETQSLIREPLRGHNHLINDVTFSPDGRRFATASNDNTVRLWDATTYEPMGEPFRGHEDWVLAVAFSPDGRFLASASKDQTVRLWDLDRHGPHGEPLRGHDSPIFAVAFSPDGHTLASVGNGLQLWDPVTTEPQSELLFGHEQLVLGVAFSPDGTMLTTASADKTVRLWDVPSRTLLGDPLRGHSAPVAAVKFSADGKILASASWDKTVVLWDLDFKSRTCRAAGRNLTPEEWRRYVGGLPYRATCPDFSVAME